MMTKIWKGDGKAVLKKHGKHSERILDDGDGFLKKEAMRADKLMRDNDGAFHVNCKKDLAFCDTDLGFPKAKDLNWTKK